MWMLSEKNLKIGDFVYYLILIYYFLQVVIVFSQFGMKDELNKIFEVLKERQYFNGVFVYIYQLVMGIIIIVRVVWNFEVVGLIDIEIYRKGVVFLRDMFYVEILEVKLEMVNIIFFRVDEGKYVGNIMGRVNLIGFDGYVVIYFLKNFLMIKVVVVEGFRVESLWKNCGFQYVLVIVVVGVFFVVMYGVVWFENRKKR